MKKHLLQLFILIVTFIAMVYPGNRIAAAVGDVGYQDFTYGAARSPTAEKPESKLWFYDGLWWGVLYDRLHDQFEIYKFDWAANTWNTTGVPVDNRVQSHQDALSVGDQLYIASGAVPPVPPALPPLDTSIHIYLYSYNPITKTYDPGQVANITANPVETVVIDQDTNGVLWLTFTDNIPNTAFRTVFISHSMNHPWVWKNPYQLGLSGSANLTPDDISTLVAYSGNIGVMWSNQNDNAVYFATHVDGTMDSTWSLNTPLSLPKYADDHLNIKSLQADPAGQVFAAVKTSLSDVNPPTSNEPEILLLMLDNQGSWSRRTVARVVDNHTRPIVLIDTENRDIYVFMTLQYPNQTSGAIYYKKVNLDDPGMQFPDGLGTPFIEFFEPDPIKPPYHINNVSSTKQSLNGTMNLLVIASDDSRQLYVHNWIDLQGPPQPPMFNVYLPLILR